LDALNPLQANKLDEQVVWGRIFNER